MKSILPILGFLIIGCSSEDIPQAHKGQLFERTGVLHFYSGGNGLTGPVLGPGTVYTGVYDQVRMVDCSQNVGKEKLQSLTKDGVQFNLDVYISYSTNCSDDSVKYILSSMSPTKGSVIESGQMYETYIRPAIGEAIRQTVSPFIANDINEKREEILSKARKMFIEELDKKEPKVVTINEVNLSNLDFPEAMDVANTERAVQAILKDKAIAERERVTAEIETMAMRKKLSENEGETAAVKIDKIGAALNRNPQYLQYDLQNKMIDIYKEAGQKGNMIIAAPQPTLNQPLKSEKKND